MAEAPTPPIAIAMDMLRVGRSSEVLAYIGALPLAERGTQAMQRILAIAFAHQGRPRDAAEAIEAAASDANVEPATVALAAKMALDQQRFDRAYLWHSRLVQSQPMGCQFWTGLFDAAAKVHALRDAVSMFERVGALTDWTESVALAVRIDAALVHLQRYDDALAHVGKLIARHANDSTARRLFVRRSVELNPCAVTATAFAAFNPATDTLDGELVDAGLALPQIFATDEQVAEWRNRLLTEVTAFTTWVRAQSAETSRTEVTYPQLLTRVPFFVAYHGCDDLAFQRAWAAFVESVVTGSARATPPSEPAIQSSIRATTARNRSRLRLGIVSAHLRDCTVGHYFAAWFDALTDGPFEVTLYSIGKQDSFTSQLSKRAHAHRHFGNGMASYASLKQAIQSDGNDVVLYPEVGMEPLVVAVAANRLAPVQVAAWGHPVTTGLSTIDYFLSSELAEPARAQTHYSERLITLPGMGTRFPQPPIARAISRSSLAVTDDQPLLMCSQSIFKWSPSFVAAVGQILKARPNAVLVYFAIHRTTPPSVFAEMLKHAWGPLGIDIARRTRVLGEMPRDGFLSHIAVCDVALDTFGFSGGQTSVDTLSANVPVVTLPGAFMRGRQTAAMLTLISVEELIARDKAHYVELVLQLVDDVAHRTQLREKISRNKSLLFSDRRAVTALTQWLSTLPVGPPPA